MPIISIIAAMDAHNGIGLNGSIPWHLPADLKYFKEITSEHIIVMGRKTWDSLPIKPLPHRRNLMLSRHYVSNRPGVEIFQTIDSLLDSIPSDEELFVIGGAEIYHQFLPIAHRLYLTKINAIFHADTFFPPIDYSQWILKKEKIFFKNTENQYDIKFQHYEKI
ncbi:MAG: dihydrofolate reductase [Bacteroidales bacterium]|nr:dihydrofolate reductase [Bacteroidales bacterium]